MSIKINNFNTSIDVTTGLSDVTNILRATKQIDGAYVVDPESDIIDADDVDNLMALPQFQGFDDETVVRYEITSPFHNAVLVWLGIESSDDANLIFKACDKLLDCTSFNKSRLKYIRLSNGDDMLRQIASKILPTEYTDASSYVIGRYFDELIQYGADESNPIEIARQKLIDDIQKGKFKDSDES